MRGRRIAELSPTALEALVAAARDEAGADPRRGGRVRLCEAKAEGRVHVVKHARAGHPGRALRDALRGSGAARAFRLGQAHALLADRAARPLAFLERRRLGLPVETWLVLEKVGDADLDRWRAPDASTQTRVAVALGEWIAEGHAWGLVHRDGKAGNLRIALRPEGIRLWWVDLEDLRGPVETSAEERRLALAQLNASLADDAFGIEARRRALDAYLRRLPRLGETEEVARDVARRSLARDHRWRGRGCRVESRRPTPDR
jgi:hypothetical protein